MVNIFMKHFYYYEGIPLVLFTFGICKVYLLVAFVFGALYRYGVSDV